MSLNLKALEYIEKLCILWENGNKKDLKRTQDIMDNIYRFSHCVQEEHSCYNSHQNWRKELQKQNWEI